VTLLYVFDVYHRLTPIRAGVDENPLSGLAFASMLVKVTPQADRVRVNSTYK
jgi:hypothetical protein